MRKRLVIEKPSGFRFILSSRPPRGAYWDGETYRDILLSLFSGSVIDGPELNKLRALVIETLGVEDAVLCGSGSLALEMALRACGVRQGEKVQGSYTPIHLLRNHEQVGRRRLPRAERIWADLIELPCEPEVRLDHLEHIDAIVKQVVKT